MAVLTLLFLINRLTCFFKLNGMKQLSLILSIVATGLAGTLLVLHLKENKKETPVVSDVEKAVSRDFKIAYFEMDSLENNFSYYKEAIEKVMAKEKELSNSLTYLQRNFQQRAAQLQQKAPTMSQSEGEAASREMLEMEQKLKDKKAEVDQQLFDFRNSLIQDTRKKVEDYLKDYNKDKGYSYIYSYEPGFIYFRDSSYNITRDILEGLNKAYKKADKK
jgi:outer membrane protein